MALRPIHRTLLWSALVLFVGSGAFISGYYLGIGKGADTISMLHAQNSVADSIGELRAEFAALERNDLAFSQAQHERSIRKALLNIGSHAHAGVLPTWSCPPAYRATMNDARLYLLQHPPAAHDPMDQMMQKAAEHCR